MRPLEERRSLAEDVGLRIKEEVLDGGFAQGERLVESTIAERLQVSRGTVREAFKLLCGQGLLTQRPRRGVYVSQLSSGDVVELSQLRAALESTAARLLAESHTDSDIEELRQFVFRYESAVTAGDTREAPTADWGFHEAVCRLAGNRRIHTAFVQNAAVLHALIHLKVPEPKEELIQSHQQLLAAIESGDSVRASVVFREHVEHAGCLAAATLDSSGGRANDR